MTYPILRPEMLLPRGAPIPTASAKQLFKKWMLQIGYLDKQEVGDHVLYLADAIKDHEQFLKDELADVRSNISEEMRSLKSDRRDLEKSLVSCKDQTQKLSIDSEIAELDTSIAQLQTEIDDAVAVGIKFKTDKREFLVDYINQQVNR